MKERAYIVYVPILFLCWLNTVLVAVNHNPRSYVIWSDSEGYYMYLPAIFILKDVHKIPSGSVLPQMNDKGEYVIKYTCGVAMMELPFFLVAKWYYQVSGKDWKDYFNLHYMRAMALSGYFYGFLGLFFLAAALRRTFSEIVVAWTILSVFLGTNLFHYLIRAMTMSHAYSFCLFAIIAWLLPLIYQKPTFGKALFLGIITGLCILIRPTNCLILLFILLYDIYTMSALRLRLMFLKEHFIKIVVASIAAALVFIPQCIYWYEMTGNFIQYSYANESFTFWQRPKISAVLLDTQNGLFIYSPMAFLMCVGLLIGIEKQRYQGLSLSLIFCISTYLFASWWAWWFGGAFGHRCYVDFYALLAIPLAGFYSRTLQLRSSLLKVIVILVSIFLMYYGVKMSFLHSRLPGPWDGADWRWNLEKIFWVWSYLFK